MIVLPTRVKTISKWREIGDQAIDDFAIILNNGGNLKAFYHKLKYTFMRRRPGRQLDREVYLLVEIVLRDMNFSVLLNELKIDIYKIQSDTWLVRSVTNDNVEYSVHKRDSENNNLDVTSYVCTSLKDLATIIVEWKESEEYDIRSLREAFHQTAQRERARIARIEVIPQVGKQKINQIVSNTKFRKQINF
ncbi:hypothetical protein C2G38_2227878 [Gigaspora rosea]|uniref:Uncharacterized protein n=1 Tax=Gigaspora rosea TaxID=44941 RepID=A0A397TWH6_9GLOM|nr:hypothetical protein C2G38_2227878 [Gigaspora rosea]